MAVAMAARPLMKVLRLEGFPILRQLQLEEALLRADDANWCIVNDGAATPAVVIGISGKPQQLLELAPTILDGVQVIKRFSGGGTVIVDKDTIFVTLICSEKAVPGLPLYPRPIMEWTEDFYKPVFRHVPGFRLREHDYVIGEKKFGGNAQSITKARWLHHTSFLWDYQRAKMAYLKMPSKAPDYRKGRDHGAFLHKLKDYLPSREEFTSSIEDAASSQFKLQHERWSDVQAIIERKHPHTTRVLDTQELESILDASLGDGG